MQLVFRKFPADVLPTPEPGEVYVRLNPVHALTGRGVAEIVLEHGTAALIQGTGPPESLVVDVALTAPTFDDMLSATFALWLLEGKRLPDGCKAFASYAAVIRKGLRPTSIPPEDSLEGIYLAVRNAVRKDADLTDPAVRDRFRKDWERLADCVLQAAEQGINPLLVSPFAGRSDFMQERAYLVHDREVYRQDVLRGERWQVRLPGGPEQASALFLRQPTSLLFPYWSRTDRDVPAGSAYLLLAVELGKGIWVISTDPAQHLPIKGLAEELQKIETSKDSVGAAADPWYDGHRPEHGHTLVASPRGGTKLAEREVLPIIKKWARARALRPTWPVRELIWIGAGVAALTLLVLIYLKPERPPPSSPSTTLVVTQDGQPIPQSSFQEVFDDQSGSCVGSKVEKRDLEPDASVPFTFEVQPPTRMPYDIDRPVRVNLLLRSMSDASLALAEIRVKINDGPEQTVPFRINRNTHDKEIPTEIVTDPIDGGFLGRQTNTLTVTVRNRSSRQRVEIEAEWLAKTTLYVLSVGVSTYPKAQGVAADLPNACKDAKALADALLKQEGVLFHKVYPQQLLNESATRQAILNEFQQLAKKKATVYDLAVVTLSGHGKVDQKNNWYFTPYDYDPGRERETGVFWKGDLAENVPVFESDVFLLIDTCHSGAVSKTLSLEGRFRTGARKGLVVIAASLSSQLAEEQSDWGHGALTLAVLEAIRGEYLYTKPVVSKWPNPSPQLTREKDPLNLRDLGKYAEDRVSHLTNSRQSVVVANRADFDSRKIAIAVPQKAHR